MTPQEKKQAERVIRTLKELEQHLLDFIANIQDARLDDGEPYAWTINRIRLEGLQRGYGVALDLMLNMERALADRPASV